MVVLIYVQFPYGLSLLFTEFQIFKHLFFFILRNKLHSEVISDYKALVKTDQAALEVS